VTKIIPLPHVYFELAPGLTEPPKKLPIVSLVHQPSTGKVWQKIDGEWRLIGGKSQ